MSAIIPTDQPSMFDVLKSLTSLQSQAIIRPQNPPAGIAGFLFDIPEEEEIRLQSVITNHFVEDNTAVVDQIALEPEEFTVRGLVAEIVSYQPPVTKQNNTPRNPLPINANLTPFPTPSQSQLTVKLGTLARLLAPGPSQFVNVAQALVTDPSKIASTIAQNETLLATQLGFLPEYALAVATAGVIAAANKSAAKPFVQNKPRTTTAPVIPPITPLVAPAMQPDPASMYGMFLNKAGQPPATSRQAQTFAYFYQLWIGRQRFTVETPWGTMVNMAILNLRATQDDETRFRSTFTITFKLIRTTSQATVTVGQLAGRTAIQGSTITQNGNAGTTTLTATANQSLLSRMISGP